MIVTSSTVDHEGNIVFERVGKLKAKGRTLNELKNNIENLIQPVPDSQMPSKSRSQTLRHKAILTPMESLEF